MSRYIFEQQWSDSGKLTDADFSKLYMSAPDKIGPALTFMMGKDNVELNPLTFMIEGKNKITEEIKSYEYEYDVVSSFTKTVPLAASISSGTPGQGGTPFEIAFPERYFSRDYSIFSPNKYELRIVEDPKMSGTNWVYKVELVTTDPSAYCPLAELTEGTFFVKGFASVAAWDSIGNDTNLPGLAKVRGNIGTIRKSFKWGGDVMNRDMTVDLSELGLGEMFWSYQQWLFEKEWQREVENYYWYATSTRKSDGSYPKDSSGAPIYRGDGLLAQIGSKDTYGNTLSYDKLQQVIRDTYTGMKDAENKKITLYTGFGGAEMFDKAVKAGALGTGFTQIAGDKFVEGSGMNLKLTGYFASFQHRDGYVVDVKTVDLFDYGDIAQNSPIHPITGLSLESHRMVFVDTSNYDGSPNIKGLSLKQSPFSRNAVLGVGAVPPGFPDTTARSSDKHASSIHYMKTTGVVMRRFNTSIDLTCNIS